MFAPQEVLRQEFLDILASIHCRKANIQMQANWSRRNYAKVIGDVLAVQNDQSILRRLRLSKNDDPDCSGHTEVNNFFSLDTATSAGARLWTMARRSDFGSHQFTIYLVSRLCDFQ